MKQDCFAAIAILLMFIGPLVLTITRIGAVLIGVGFTAMLVLIGVSLRRS